MIINKYGITLIRLKREHLELVRQKRNLPYIQEKMIFKKKISKWRQWRWYRKINNMYNYYFIIEYKGNFIGLVNGKNADFETRTMEGGIFIWESNYWNTHIPLLASVVMHDCSFFISNFNTLYAKVLFENKNAINFNTDLGYTTIQEQNGYLLMQLKKADYQLKVAKIRDYLIRITKDKEILNANDIFFDDEDEKSRKLLYSKLPKDIYNQYFDE